VQNSRHWYGTEGDELDDEWFNSCDAPEGKTRPKRRRRSGPGYGDTPAVRWLRRGDLRRLWAIERACFEKPSLNRAGIDLHLGRRCFRGLGAKVWGRLAGFLLLESWHDCLLLRHVAVQPGFRRQGLGRLLVAEAIRRAGAGLEALAFVPERALLAQLLLRACGFRAYCVDRGNDPDDNGGSWPPRVRHCGARPCCRTVAYRRRSPSSQIT
jgi:GNAT superfamily N-acetyltransferase